MKILISGVLFVAFCLLVVTSFAIYIYGVQCL